MRRSFFPLACLATMVIGAAATAPLAQRDLDTVGVNPPADARLPSGLAFVDQQGRLARLDAGPRPTLLLFADYTCRHLCGPGVTLTAGALHDAGLRSPRDYALVVIGLDQDGPARARAFAAERLGGLPEEADAARFLTGTPATVAAAEAAVGYRAAYDPASDQFAHDAASFLFTPDGRLSRVLPETAVTPAMLAGAIAAAARGEAMTAADGGAVARIVTLCYGFAAAHGVHGAAIVAILRALGVLTIAGIALFVWRLSRRRRAIP